MQFDAAGAGPGLLVAMHDAGSWRAAGGGVASEQTMLRDAAEAVGEPTRDAGGKCMMLAGCACFLRVSGSTKRRNQEHMLQPWALVLVPAVSKL